MAFKKVPAKKSKRTATELPEGFTKVDATSRPPFHDFNTHPLLIGRVVRVRSGRANENGYSRRYMDINSGGKMCTVSEWFALRGLFDTVSPGSEVMIEKTGEEVNPNRDKPDWIFNCAIRSTKPRASGTGGGRG